MWNKLNHRSAPPLLLATFTVAAIVGIGIWLCAPSRPGLRQVTHAQLELRDGMLYARGEVQPFDGQIVEYYPDHARKLALEIKHGRLNGHSLGWHANGQMEVDEQFVDGISQGTRKRWFPNGQQRSEADVQNGKVTGTYKEWHENGQLAVVMSTEDGKANGAVEAWHPSGALKSRSQMKQGEVLERQFFPDSVAQAQTAQQLPQ